MPDITLLILDDWQVLYDSEGQQSLEGHRISAEDLLSAVAPEVRVLNVAGEPLDTHISESGRVPETLAELLELQRSFTPA